MEVIKKTKEGILIQLSSDISNDTLERIVDYINYIEITQNSTATQEMVDKLTDEVNRSWWSKNRERLVK